jgi:hypothetical protein
MMFVLPVSSQDTYFALIEDFLCIKNYNQSEQTFFKIYCLELRFCKSFFKNSFL